MEQHTIHLLYTFHYQTPSPALYSYLSGVLAGHGEAEVLGRHGLDLGPLLEEPGQAGHPGHALQGGGGQWTGGTVSTLARSFNVATVETNSTHTPI